MRIVVTGIGLVTPLGDDFWECIKNGKAKGYRVSGYPQGKDRYMAFGSDAVKKAISDSTLSAVQLKNAGITFSSSKGNVIFNDVITMPNTIGGEIGCFGPSLNVISACTTGLNSIIIGIHMIKTGKARVVIAGASDACLTDFIIAGFNKLGVISKDGICRPYSKNRSGFVLSEGACAIVIEELDHAKKRNAKIYGEITGWANLGDAYHITSQDPSGDTIVNAIRICLEKSGSFSEEIDYINTHGTGTLENDLIETKAIKKFFGKKVYKISVSSTKAVTGHMLGATGAIEMAVCFLSMKEGIIPPTANLDKPDPLCDLDYVPGIKREKKINKFLTLSYGFGGHVTCIEGKRFL